MYGHRQHALHSAGDSQPHTLNAGVQESNAPEQTSTPDLCSSSSCPATTPRKQKRRDTRIRSGRGGLQAESLAADLAEQQLTRGESRVRVSHMVPASQLPARLRDILPRSVRVVCVREPESSPLHEGTYVTRLATPAYGLVTEGDIEITAEEKQLIDRLTANPAAPGRVIRVAPAFFLNEALRMMIAPEVSFPATVTVPALPLKRRVSLSRGAQIAISGQTARQPIDALSVSARTILHLKGAGVATLDMLLEMEEAQLTAILSDEDLWQVYVALCAQQLLPTPSGVLPAAPPENVEPAPPVFAEFYYYLTGTVYDDDSLGRLYLAYVSVFADRLDGLRSGSVETVWLTREQVSQSLLWEPELAILDTHELRSRVNTHAVARGAKQPSLVPSDEAAWQRARTEHEMEERYNLVPLRHELFVSSEDLHGEEARGFSPTRNVLRMLDRYMRHPALQPIGDCLPLRLLEEMHYWIGEDRRRQYYELPSPASPSIVRHAVYVLRRQKVQDRTGKMVMREMAELVGYRLIIGVLATTPVWNDLIVEPRRGKPQFTAPLRPIQPRRTPNYVAASVAA